MDTGLTKGEGEGRVEFLDYGVQLGKDLPFGEAFTGTESK